MVTRIIVDGVTVRFGRMVALEDISLRLEGPGLIQVLGPNGAGKTTLFKTMLGIVKPVKGNVYVDSVDVTGKPELAGKYIAYMPQIPPEIDVPLTPYEAVEAYLTLYHRKWPRIAVGKQFKQLIEEALRAVGLPQDAWHKPLSSLSGGQRQRVMLARVIAVGKPVMLLDEPLASIDPAGRAEVAKLIGQIARSRLVIASSHDPTLLKPYTKLFILLNRRLIAVGSAEEVLRTEVLRKVYGEAAIEVAPGHVHIADSHVTRLR